MYLLMHFNANVDYPVHESMKSAASRLLHGQEMDSLQMGMRLEKSRVLRNKQANNNNKKTQISISSGIFNIMEAGGK